MAIETMGGDPIVIDLGIDRGEPETYASPTRPTYPGWLAPLVIAVIVLVTLGASAAPPPARCRPPTTSPATPRCPAG